MNDLEHDLRTLLEHKADDASAGAPAPDRQVLRRARRRQLGTVIGGVFVTAAVVVGAAVAISALAPSNGGVPLEPVDRLVSSTVNGVTLEHPQGWYVVDPVEAGIQPASRDLPRLLLFVSPSDPVASGFPGCPGMTDEATDGFVLTIQEEPLAFVGEGARAWPVELAPMEGDASESGCYPGWTFRRASWTAAGRTFEARVGIGPDASGSDREALDAAFASLRSAPTEIGPEAVVIATGTAGGEDWELIATRDGGGLGLTLQWSTGGSGIGGTRPVADEIQSTAYDFAVGGHHEIVVVGAITADATTVAAVPEIGSRVSVDVIDVPDPIGGALDAFVLTYVYDAPDPRGATLTAYDEDGHVLATGTVPPPPLA